jgi:hypothetical protein
MQYGMGVPGTCFLLKLEVAVSTKMLIPVYQIAWCHILKDCGVITWNSKETSDLM